MASLLDLYYGGGGNGLDYTVPFAQDPQRQQRGLLGLLGGGGAGDMYGDALSDQQKAALQQRGLLGFLGGLVKSGALDYTVPFISGKVPGGFAAGVAGGMAGMGEAQDSGALNAMRGQLLGLQGQQIKGNLGLLS